MHQKLMGGGDTQHSDLVSLLLLFQNKESRLEIYKYCHAFSDRRRVLD
jgi:hypothetical protein